MIRAVLPVVMIAWLVFGTDARFRLERRFPSPRGIIEHHWAGDAWAFFHRTAFEAGKLSGVILLEKDPGEKWGDLAAGGLRWEEGGTIRSVSAGFLRLRMALGITVSHGGMASGADPLSLVKPPVLREELEPATSPGDCDARPLCGAGVLIGTGGFDVCLFQAVSSLDRFSTGLHRSITEISDRGSIRETLSYARISTPSAGVSGVLVGLNADSSQLLGRAGFDFNLSSGAREISGEASLGFEDGGVPIAFFVGMFGESGTFRHSVSAGRCPASFPAIRSSTPFGEACNLAGGYGIRWKPRNGLTITSGLQLIDSDDGTSVEAAAEAEETPFDRTSLSQKLTVASSEGETTYRGCLGATWSSGRNTTVTLRLPATLWVGGDSTASGAGAEFRLRHAISNGMDATLSAAAADTEGFGARVYIYKVSFPGEFGSSAIYGKCAMLQASISVSLGEDWRLRGRISRFHGYDRDSIGSGYEQTEGPSRTEAGLQLDWNP